MYVCVLIFVKPQNLATVYCKSFEVEKFCSFCGLIQNCEVQNFSSELVILLPLCSTQNYHAAVNVYQ